MLFDYDKDNSASKINITKDIYYRISKINIIKDIF